MQGRSRAFFERAPIKLIAVILFAILIPSLLVTSLGLLAVFQADAFVRDRFLDPVRERVARLRAAIGDEWGRRLDLYARYLSDAPARRDHLREICRKDPFIRDVVVTTGAGLEIVPEPPPLRLWSADGGAELAALERLELVEKDAARALSECERLLEVSTDDAVVVEVLLAAARTSYRLGGKDRALGFLRSCRDRYGRTVDATGIVRELPLLWRIFEIERELGQESRAVSTAAEFASALKRYGRHMDADARAFYEQKLVGLEDAYRPLAPLEADGEAGRAAPVTESSLRVLAQHLPSPAASAAGRRIVITHASTGNAAMLDIASFASEGELRWVHLVLDRDRLLADVRLHASLVGLADAGLGFEPAPSASVRAAASGGGDGDLSVVLPAPLDHLVVSYTPVAGELPRGFRGFNVLSLATFTWTVIVLVLSILVGVLFTVRSVLREMRTARLKTDFVSFISHELKTPLTSVRMFTETILSGRVENEEEQKFCIQMIDQESERLSKLVEQILEYSKIESREKEFRFVSCDMESVVREAARIFQDRNRQDPRDVEVNAVQRISKIKMDRASMIELFLNLYSNAAKYSQKGSKITVNLRESIDDISVDVIDQGVGIRKRDHKRIFDKFYRADDYLTREVEGTGLGLTFARYIAKVHNGELKVSSQVNAGSCFTLQIRKTDVLAE